jgi:hypothetical protein
VRGVLVDNQNGFAPPLGCNSTTFVLPASISSKGDDMRKLMTIIFALSLLTALGLAAQDTVKQDNMKAGTSAKAASITGKISDDGKTFVSDKDGKSWTINNPDVVKGHEGHHVTLKAHVSADTNAVDVVSLKMAGDNMKSNMK